MTALLVGRTRVGQWLRWVDRLATVGYLSGMAIFFIEVIRGNFDSMGILFLVTAACAFVATITFRND